MPRCYLDKRGSYRCETDNKVAYVTELEARQAVMQSHRYTSQQLRAYQSDCGWWHMTSSI